MVASTICTAPSNGNDETAAKNEIVAFNALTVRLLEGRYGKSISWDSINNFKYNNKLRFTPNCRTQSC